MAEVAAEAVEEDKQQLFILSLFEQTQNPRDFVKSSCKNEENKTDEELTGCLVFNRIAVGYKPIPAEHSQFILFYQKPS